MREADFEMWAAAESLPAIADWQEVIAEWQVPLRILRAREEDPAPPPLEVAYQDRSFSIETWLARATRRRDSDDGVLEPSLLVTFYAPDRQGAWPATAFAACSLAATLGGRILPLDGDEVEAALATDYARILLETDKRLSAKHVSPGQYSDEPVRSASTCRPGWIQCPGCERKFSLRDKTVWDGERHVPCGQRISPSRKGRHKP